MRLLVAEDERDLNRLLQKVLTKAGYTVDGCYDGEEALLYLQGTAYDALVLDVMMPRKDGYTLVQEMRSQGMDTPVLFLTARDSVADRVKGLDLGADDYLVKPFDFDELLARLRAMTRKHVGQRTNTLIVGDLTLDTAPGRGGDCPAAQGVCHFRISHAPPGHRSVPGADRGPDLELRVRRQLQQRGRLPQPPAEEDRRGPGGEAPPHRTGHGLGHPAPRRGEGPMKRRSVQVRLTLWYTLLMAGMAGLLLVFLLVISGAVSRQTAMDQLETTLRENLSQVSLGDDGSLQLGEDFSFYQNGVYTLVYSQSQALLAGQVPVSFTASEPFQNGQTRPVDGEGGRYYVLDFWVPQGWESGLWVRGILEAPENPQTVTNLVFIAVVTLPAFILLAALGGYGIVHRAFRPLEEITATAAAINEAADLSARVAVPPGDHEFSRLADTFNQMFGRLEGSFEAEQQFTADASHELRTPVAVIKSACEYAEKYGETPQEQQETLAMIHRQADRMTQLIQQLLSITRLEQGTEPAQREALDLAALVTGVCADQPYPKDRLACQVQPGVWVRGDRGLLARLLQNLIDNGFAYGKPQGHVWVTLGTEGDQAVLQVRDDGIGIPQDQQEKIWQRFYQVDPARREGGGAGLGLAMVKKIAQLHGGRITLDSTPGQGSTFTLSLPLEKELFAP